MNGPGDESAGGTGRDGDASPNRYDQLISENQFLLEKLHAEHDRRARLKLEAMLAETPAIHFELDQQQRLAYVNPTWSRELLHPVSDVLGHPLSDFVAPSHRAVLAAALTERTREDHTDSAPDICFIDREGRPLWMSVRFRLNRSGTISGNMQNVSVHRELENERLRTQKINSIGRFAAGFAHDFNNLLMAITANLDITRRKLESRDILLEEVSLALRACGHASQITKQLMNYSSIGQEQLPVVTPASITELVEEAVEIAFRGSQVQPILSIDPGIPMVKMDGSQIHQVLNNLLLNAEQSMPEGGVIKIRIRERYYAPPSNPNHQEGVAIEIRDQGVGIAKEDLEQVLEPYFTTKEMGNGLGLTTAYWIVKHHDGLMEIESAPGSGTMVRVTLPVSEVQASPAESSARSHPVQESLTVLVMDDDDQVRSVLASMLELLGHRVLTSRNGEECLAKYLDSRVEGSELPSIDVLVLDLVVAGGRGGIWTLDRLREVDPEVRAVVSTGFSKDPVVEDYASHGFVGALRKPYTVDELQARLSAACEIDPLRDPPGPSGQARPRHP